MSALGTIFYGFMPRSDSRSRSNSRTPTVEITNAASPDTPFDHLATFRLMTLRRLQRGLGGTVEAPRSSRLLSVLGFALFACGMLSFSVYTPEGSNTTVSGGVSLSIQLSLADNVLIVVIALLSIFLGVLVIDTVRVCVYWLAFGLLAYLLLMLSCPRSSCAEHDQISTAILGTTLGLLLATLAIRMALHTLYPYLLQNACCCLRDVAWWWGIAPQADADAPNAMEGAAAASAAATAASPGLITHRFTYRPESRRWPGGLRALGRLLGKPPRRFSYHGSLDADGLPHGEGTWHDTALHGETLEGHWLHGVPIAPFHAAEYASGSSFAAVRIAYCHNRAEPDLYSYWWSALRSPKGLMWGVASVECSIAGGYYKHLPQITELVGMEANRSAAWCREHLKPAGSPSVADPSAIVVEQPPLADALLVTAGPQGLRVGGYTPAGGQAASKVTIHWEPSPLLPATRQLTEEDAAAAEDDDEEAPMSPTTKVKPNSSGASSSSSPSSAVPSKLPNGRLRLGNDGSPDAPMQWVAEGERPEAVIFLHGFNSPIADALKRVAQLWTLGDFPSNYELFVFGWPGGRDVTYFSAKAWCDDHPLMNADFTEFISSLIDAGYGRIHMLCHSMGAMILLSALSYEPFLKLFRRPGGGDGAGRGRESSGGGSSGAVAAEAEASPVGRVRMSTCILINPDASLEQFKARDFPLLRKVCDHITLYADHADGALWFSEKFNRWTALGKHPFQLYRSAGGSSGRLSTNEGTPPGTSGGGEEATTPRSGGGSPRASTTPAELARARSSRIQGVNPLEAGDVPLDMDVVDVSWMDGNMHAMRHNFFNINRWMVDDLREILVKKRRARMRTTRMTHRFSNVWSFLAVPTHVVNP